VAFNPGDLVNLDFPGVTGMKRRPAVVLSSATYHALRPDIIVGLITSQMKNVYYSILHVVT
jgi:mRNA interferase MazF